MKKVFLLIIAVLALFSCKSVPEGACVIEGKVVIPDYKTMYLVDYLGNQLDSADRSNDGSFSFVYEGEPMPQVVVLEFRNPESAFDVMYLPVALEPGKVNVVLGEYIGLSGTPLNNSIKKFFDEMQTLSDKFEAEVATLEAKKSAFSAFYLKKMLENDDNVLGDYLKMAYSRELTQEDLQKLLNK